MPKKTILKVTKLHFTTVWRFVTTINFESVGQFSPPGSNRVKGRSSKHKSFFLLLKHIFEKSLTLMLFGLIDTPDLIRRWGRNFSHPLNPTSQSAPPLFFTANNFLLHAATVTILFYFSC